MTGTPAPTERSRQRRSRVLVAGGAGLCAGLALSGCSDFRRAAALDGGGVNVESPVAPAVLAATRARLVTPRFSDIPPAPRNTPPPAAFRARIDQQVAARTSLERWADAHPAPTADAEGFAARGRAGAALGGAAPADGAAAAADAYAARMRAAAVPPPPPS